MDAPTLKESDIDLEFTDWRGVVAPPELSEADKAALVDAVAKMHETADRKAALEKNGWTDAICRMRSSPPTSRSSRIVSREC